MIVLDTDVLAVHHIFHNDPRYKVTKKLIDSLENTSRAVTIFNLLELCGILATAGKKDDAKTLFDAYLAAADVAVLFPQFSAQDKVDFWSTLASECFFSGPILANRAPSWLSVYGGKQVKTYTD